jgi:peptidyl-dipeptidase Dcp
MTATSKTANPLLETWTAPFGAPPLDRIAAGHFIPAFDHAIQTHRAEIEAIATDPAPPSFANVVDALELAGAQLKQVSRVLGLFSGALASPEIQAIEREIAPRQAAHWSFVLTHPDLFARLEALASRPPNDLTAEQARVLELTHRRFARAGAKLDSAGRARMSAIDERLATLGAQFSQNVLKDETDYLLVLEGEEDLAGLPIASRAAAAKLAAERGHAGGWAFSLGRSSVEPFLAYSERRDLRETIQRAWTRRGEGGGETDNRAIIAETLRLRRERANLLGYDTFAQYKLDGTMAEEPLAARNLLEAVWAAGLARAHQERGRLQELIDAEGGDYRLAAHDWRYLAEKARKADYDIDDAELRAYLPLDKVAAAAFYVAERLFGLRFRQLFDAPIHHPDARVFEVTDSAGDHVALFYADYFARPGKRSGAWMSQLRGQRRLGEDVRPIVYNVMNFAAGDDSTPCLLGLDDARTLFHEFGHALHGMLSNVTYPSIAGTSVPPDFVELPSQLFEHWLLTPEVLRLFARHFRTGERLPEALVERVRAAATFNQGFAAVEYCASALVDLDMHSRVAPDPEDPMTIEVETLARIAMPAEIAMRHRSPHFAHVFSGSHYAAGYYSYLWSEMLDADAFAAFEATGDVFDRSLAERLRSWVLSAGDVRPPREAYVGFRGRMPGAEALLAKRGLLIPGSDAA